jgi:ABC-type multidrug transport system fused ATPase/permease subunit
MENEPQTRIPFRDQLGMLATYLRPQRGVVALLGALLLGSIGLQLYSPQIMRQFIDSATAGAADRALIIAAGMFLVVALVQQATTVWATYLSENIGWTATNAVRGDLLAHCLGLDPSFHKGRTPGELIERIDGDATVLSNFFSQLVLQVAANLVLLVGVLVILWAIDGRIGLLLTGFALVLLLAMRSMHNLAWPRWKVARQRTAELFGFIEERLAGTEDIRSSGAQPYTMRRLYQHLGDQYRSQMQARLASRLVWTTSDLLRTVAGAATLVLGAQLFRSEELTIGTIYSITFYLGLLWRPLMQITRQAEDFQKAGAGIARIHELFQTQSALTDTGRASLPDGPLSVTFRDVRFAYATDEEPVIEELSFHLPPGRVLGLLGRTGSGKTTLTRLLFRLYDTLDGSIEVGGVALPDVPLAELRRRVGIVTQEVQLFHATVRDNLTLFDPSISDGRILEAIGTLGLRPWFEGLPEGLDTELAAGGGGVSAGEAQLLAFTRIFLRDPGLVILDEASSRLDPATEQLIERAVDRLLRDRTAIIIAHRLHTVHRADEILILEGGRALEHGDRRKLLADNNSRFSALLRTGVQADAGDDPGVGAPTSAPLPEARA